mmetsp:Transcript_21165/g.27869  ORF Transcript_21165/g.27869 Transcript_21165/m.27869 type:complete len:102 (+) Transcript_21165:337-642(+)
MQSLLVLSFDNSLCYLPIAYGSAWVETWDQPLDYDCCEDGGGSGVLPDTPPSSEGGPCAKNVANPANMRPILVCTISNCPISFTRCCNSIHKSLCRPVECQ